MSEPNSPLNPQAVPGLESSLDWWNPFPELTETEVTPESQMSSNPDGVIDPPISEVSQASSSPSQEVSIIAPVNSDVAPVIAHIVVNSPGDGAPVAPPTAPPTASPTAPPAAFSEATAAIASEPSESPPASSEPPNLIDLISLIQELNQCNGVLLDRVSQLEEALDRSQQALQGQMGRSPEAVVPQDEDPLTAQAQIDNLFSQLEFAHQTNQRQHIVIETLTAELESSQERVALLEREAALLQQRYNDQTQLLVQAEGTARDLQARLQRQQRYTLQFKAALEKCLEMPIPQGDGGAETIAPPSDSLLLPKAQQIQPWSQPPAPQESMLPWMKRFKNAAEHSPLDAEQESSEVEALLAEIAPVEEANSIEELAPPKVSVVQLPVLSPMNAANATENQQMAQESDEGAAQFTFLEHTQSGEQIASEEIASEEKGSASISYDLKGGAGSVPPTPLLTQLDAVVQPLADRLAEALLSQATGADLPETEPPALAQGSPAEAVPAELPEAESDSVMIADPDRLLASAMSEAEDALWQDLARLMEVSPEEAVKASLTGDLAAFESLNFEGIADTPAAPQRIAQDPPAPQSPAPSKPKPIAELPLTAAQPARTTNPGMDKGTAEPQTPASPTQEPVIPALANHPNSPSPLLHPFRPTKGKRSLSSVELPSFLRQEDSNPLPT